MSLEDFGRIPMPLWTDGIASVLPRPKPEPFWTLPSRRKLPCACGGSVTADPRQPTAYVAAHNRGARHRAWWAAAEPEWHPWTREETVA